MVTIIGNGIGESKEIDYNRFDLIVCDKSLDLELQNLQKLSFKEIKEFILNNKNQKILYIVSGSPTFYSGGLIIAQFLQEQNIDFEIIPNTSSKDYLLSKLSINEELVTTISLHGRDFIDLSKLLINRYTLILSDEFTLIKLKEVFKFLDSNDIEITLASNFGYENESISKIDLNQFDNLSNFMPYLLLIERKFELDKKLSRDSDFFQDDGMITKKTKRWLTIGALELEPNQIFWDIGSGSGSIGIDSFKIFRVKSYFFEKNSKRFKDIEQNLTKHRVLDSKLFFGDFFENIDKIQTADRIFIGGGGEKLLSRFIEIYERLNSNGILIINLVSIKNISKIVEILKTNKIEFELESISINEYREPLYISEPHRELFQIKVKKTI